MKDNKYTFYWLTGQREVLSGTNPADALNKAGYGHGALAALDFYSNGEDESYEWINKRWEKKEGQ